jgi:RNA polymerase sigma-70 factor, ECF subfamily
MTDQELIEGLTRKERAAIHFLVNKYQRQVIKTAHYFLQNMEEAEDLSQEIFIDILNAAPGFRKSASVSTWIYRITVNKSLNQVKKIKRRNFIQRMSNILKYDAEEKIDRTEPSSGSETPIEQKEDHRILENAIGQLSDNQRIAFILSKYDDLSYQEIADIMNLSISSVESLLHRAKINLQKKLIQHFPEYKKH